MSESFEWDENVWEITPEHLEEIEQCQWSNTINNTVNSGKLTLAQLHTRRERTVDYIENRGRTGKDLADDKLVLKYLDRQILVKLGYGKIHPLKIPAGRKICFLGYCPAADVDRRLDEKWKSEQIAEIWNWEGEKVDQHAKFTKVEPGDLIFLKKNLIQKGSIELCGYGFMREVKEDFVREDGFPQRTVSVDWAPQNTKVVIPMVATATVNLKDIEQVEAAATEEFCIWCGWQKGQYE